MHVQSRQTHLAAAAGPPRRDGSSCGARSRVAGCGRVMPGPLMERSSCRGGPSDDGGSAEVHRRLDLTWRSASSCCQHMLLHRCLPMHWFQVMSAKLVSDAAPCTAGRHLSQGICQLHGAALQQGDPDDTKGASAAQPAARTSSRCSATRRRFAACRGAASPPVHPEAQHTCQQDVHTPAWDVSVAHKQCTQYASADNSCSDRHRVRTNVGELGHQGGQALGALPAAAECAVHFIHPQPAQHMLPVKALPCFQHWCEGCWSGCWRERDSLQLLAVAALPRSSAHRRPAVRAQFPQLREGALAAGKGALERLGVGVVERGVHDWRQLLVPWPQCRRERHERGSNPA